MWKSTGKYVHPRERVRSHADHGEILAVQADGPADDGRIARELALPEIRPEHRDGIAAGDDVFVVPETAPHPRLHAEHTEVITGDQDSAPDERRGPELGAEADGHQGSVGDHAVVALRVVADIQVLAIGERVEAIVAGCSTG
jgi:hypothetical protein